jgi:sec-independent protein translocase protein TatC
MAKTRKSRNPIDCTMSLGDHLEELRARLILAVLGLFVGMVVSLIFGTHILNFIEGPYNRMMSKRLGKIEGQRVKSEVGAVIDLFFEKLTQHLASDPNAPNIDPKLVAFVRSVSAETVDAWAEKTKATIEGGQLPPDRGGLVTLAPAEAFIAYMKVSLVSGLILTSPWVFYQIWMFVAAGLYESERRYIRTAIPFSTGLFVTGALFFLFVITPVTLKFFLSFNDIIGVVNNWTLSKYISFVTVLMLVFGIAFQTPIAVFILVRTGLVSLQTLRSIRKYVIIGLAFLSAVATPSPDPYTMIALLIPLYALYELGIALSVFAEKKAKAKEAQEAAGTPSD